MIEKYKEIDDSLKAVLNPTRYSHTLGAAYMAASLAMCHEYDLNQAFLAGLLHDCAKCKTDNQLIVECEKFGIPISEDEKRMPYLLHAKVGAKYASTCYHIEDEEVWGAIRCHTTGKTAMSKLEQIIFTADFIEPGRRDFDGLADIRKTAFQDLELAVYKILESTILFLGKKSGRDMDKETVKAFEYYRELCKDRL